MVRGVEVCSYIRTGQDPVPVLLTLLKCLSGISEIPVLVELNDQTGVEA